MHLVGYLYEDDCGTLGMRVASSGENDVWLSDNVDFFSASYPEPRQEADGCYMTPKRDSKKSKGPKIVCRQSSEV